MGCLTFGIEQASATESRARPRENRDLPHRNRRCPNIVETKFATTSLTRSQLHLGCRALAPLTIQRQNATPAACPHHNHKASPWCTLSHTTASSHETQRKRSRRSPSGGERLHSTCSTANAHQARQSQARGQGPHEGTPGLWAGLCSSRDLDHGSARGTCGGTACQEDLSGCWRRGPTVHAHRRILSAFGDLARIPNREAAHGTTRTTTGQGRDNFTNSIRGLS